MKDQNFDFVLTFPDLGKATAEKFYPGVVYLAFAYLRSAFKVSKYNSAQLMEVYSKLVQCMCQSGYTVLVDNAHVLPYLKQKHLEGVVAIPRQCKEKTFVCITREGRAFDLSDKALLHPMKQFYRESAEKYGYKAVEVDALVVGIHKEEQHEEKGKTEKSR